MSRYGSVTVTGPTSVVTRIVESASPDDLTVRANSAITSLPNGYRVVGLTLAGAGDGHTFTVTIEAGAAADAQGGFTSPPTVTCFLASEAEAMLLARQAAAPASGVFADTQIAGASKGTSFMGMVVKGVVPSGGGLLVHAGFDNSVDEFIYVPGVATPILRLGVAPLQVVLTGFKPGNVILVAFSVVLEDAAGEPSGYQVDLIPAMDVGAGIQQITVNSIRPNLNTNDTPTTWIGAILPSNVTQAPKVQVWLRSGGPDQVQIFQFGAWLTAIEFDVSGVTTLPSAALAPIPP